MTLPIDEELRGEIAALEKRLQVVESKYDGKPAWYKVQYGERRLKKLRNKINEARSCLQSIEDREALEAVLAQEFPRAYDAIHRKL